MSASNYDLNAVHGLNKYLWSELQTQLGWDKNNYGGLTPITVPAQQPEFNAYSSPYIVYNYTITNQSNLIKQEQVAYAIYSQDESDIRRALNLIEDALSREDDSAYDINRFIDSQISETAKNFDYKWTQVTSISGAQPPVQEGGRMDGLAIVRVGYTVSSDGKGRRDGRKFIPA